MLSDYVYMLVLASMPSSTCKHMSGIIMFQYIQFIYNCATAFNFQKK